MFDEGYVLAVLHVLAADKCSFKQTQKLFMFPQMLTLFFNENVKI